MDSNKARARATAKAKARIEADRERTLVELARALNGLDGAQEALNAARERVDVALVKAANLHVPELQLRDLLGWTHATFWRRVKAARESVGE